MERTEGGVGSLKGAYDAGWYEVRGGRRVGGGWREKGRKGGVGWWHKVALSGASHPAS